MRSVDSRDKQIFWSAAEESWVCFFRSNKLQALNNEAWSDLTVNILLSTSTCLPDSFFSNHRRSSVIFVASLPFRASFRHSSLVCPFQWPLRLPLHAISNCLQWAKISNSWKMLSSIILQVVANRFYSKVLRFWFLSSFDRLGYIKNNLVQKATRLQRLPPTQWFFTWPHCIGWKLRSNHLSSVYLSHQGSARIFFGDWDLYFLPELSFFRSQALLDT